MKPVGDGLDLTAELSIEVDGAPVRVTSTARNGTRPGRADVRELAGAEA